MKKISIILYISYEKANLSIYLPFFKYLLKAIGEIKSGNEHGA
jgi:hypothetical protein